MLALLALSLVNALTPVGLRPVLVKDKLERSGLNRFETVEFLLEDHRVLAGSNDGPNSGERPRRCRRVFSPRRPE